MLPFGVNKPKPLYQVIDKPVLQYGLDELNNICQQIIVIVGYLASQVEDFVRTLPYSSKIQFVYQEAPYNSGTAFAVLQAANLIKGDEFILINGDEIYDHRFYKDIQNFSGRVVMSKFFKDWQSAGIFKITSGLMEEVVEKPTEFIGNAGNINFVKFLRSDLSYLDKILPNPIRGELEITDFYNLVAADYPVRVVESAYNFDQIGYPHQLLATNLEFLKRLGWKNYIGKDTRLDPSCKIINSVVGDNCLIGEGAIISNSVLGQGVEIGPGVRVEYSVIGDNNQISDPDMATIKLRPQKTNSSVEIEVKGRKIDTELPYIGINLAEDYSSQRKL